MVAFDFFFSIKCIFCNPVYWRQLYLLKWSAVFFFVIIIVIVFFLFFFFDRSEEMNEMNNKALIREKHSDDIY